MEASDSAVSPDLQQLQKADEEVLQALDTAAQAVDELAKMSGADRQAATQLCEQFVKHVQAAQCLAKPIAQRYAECGDYRAAAYVDRLAAEVAQRRLVAARRQLREARAALGIITPADDGGAADVGAGGQQQAGGGGDVDMAAG